MYLGDIYTISANLAGLPGICLPCGLDSRGLPIGLQLVGDCFQEKKLIQAAFSYEQAMRPFPGLSVPGRRDGSTRTSSARTSSCWQQSRRNGF